MRTPPNGPEEKIAIFCVLEIRSLQLIQILQMEYNKCVSCSVSSEHPQCKYCFPYEPCDRIRHSGNTWNAVTTPQFQYVWVIFVLSLYSYVAVYILAYLPLFEFRMNVKRSIYHNDFDYLHIHSIEFEFIARQIKMFSFRRVFRSTNTMYTWISKQIL